MIKAISWDFVVAMSFCEWTGSMMFYWILDLLDKDRYDLVTDRVCSWEEIELEQPQVRKLESLPGGHPIQPRSRPL